MKYREPLLSILLSLTSFVLCQRGGRFELKTKPFSSSVTSPSLYDGQNANKAFSNNDDGQYHPSADEGQYHPSGDDGQYYPMDEGKYIHDNSGAYTSANGHYVPTDEGRYYPSSEGQYLAANLGTGAEGQYRSTNEGPYKTENGKYIAGTGSRIPSSAVSVFPSSLSSKPGADFETLGFLVRPGISGSVAPSGPKIEFGGQSVPLPTGSRSNTQVSKVPTFSSTFLGSKTGLDGKISTSPSALLVGRLHNRLSAFPSTTSGVKSVTGGRTPTFLSSSSIGGRSNKYPTYLSPAIESKPELGGTGGPSSSFSVLSPVPSDTKLSLSGKIPLPSATPELSNKVPLISSTSAGIKHAISGNFFSSTSRVSGPSSKLPVFAFASSGAKPDVAREIFTPFASQEVGGSSSKLLTHSDMPSATKPKLGVEILAFPAYAGSKGLSSKSFLSALLPFGPKPDVSGKISTFALGPSISRTSSKLPLIPSIVSVLKSDSVGRITLFKRPESDGSICFGVVPSIRGKTSTFPLFPSKPKLSHGGKQLVSPSSYEVGGSGSKFSVISSIPSFGVFQSSAGGIPLINGQYSPTSEGQYRPVGPKDERAGQYRPSTENQHSFDNFGKYGSGGDQYRPSDGGQYRPSGEGQYKHDDSGGYSGNSGQYVHDDSGKYKHDDRKYVHEDVGGGQYTHQPEGIERYRPDESGGGQYKPERDNSRRYTPDKDDYSGYTFEGSGKYRPEKKTINPGISGVKLGGKVPVFPLVPESTGPSRELSSEFGLLGAVKHGSDVCSYEALRNYKIIRQKGELHQDNYHYLYETENCMYGEERGKLYNQGTKDEVMRAEGVFYYVGPDKMKYTVTYTADENGFIPHGDHLPTSPPVPAAILRSLEYKKSIGDL